MEDELDNEFYLNLILRKSTGETDEDGNYIFEVEASNENIDLQKQIVLQRALLESKEDFLKVGIVSFDHLHKRRGEDGQVISDPSMIIGEPIEVRTEGKSTIVKGKLYHNNDKARDIIKLLKAKSTRIKASVGGIFPKIIKDAKTGVEKITRVFWNDLALTPSPVNHTVSPAYFAKSYDPDEFVKAITAVSETSEHAEFSGGRAMIPENVGETVDVTKTSIGKLVRLMGEGIINKESDAVGFLVKQGMEEGKARTAVREIIFQGGQSTMKKGKFANAVSSILKSLTGEKAGEETKEEEEDGILADDLELGDDPEQGGGEGGEDDKKVEKSKVIDASQLIVGLQDDIEGIRKSMDENSTRYEELEKSIADIGEAVVNVAQVIAQIANAPVPTQSIMGKGGLGGPAIAKGGFVAPKERPTSDDLEEVQMVLNKAYREGRIDLHRSTRIESDMQKAIRDPGFNLRAEDYQFLVKEMQKQSA
jgi:hypothetical protein